MIDIHQNHWLISHQPFLWECILQDQPTLSLPGSDRYPSVRNFRHGCGPGKPENLQGKPWIWGFELPKMLRKHYWSCLAVQIPNLSAETTPQSPILPETVLLFSHCLIRTKFGDEVMDPQQWGHRWPEMTQKWPKTNRFEKVKDRSIPTPHTSLAFVGKGASSRWCVQFFFYFKRAWTVAAGKALVCMHCLHAL